jgi:hypothetical protein
VFLSLVFRWLIILSWWCGFEFNQFGILSTSWVCMFISFRTFSGIISSYTSSVLLYFSFPRILMIRTSDLLLMSHRSLKLFVCSWFPLCCSNQVDSIDLPSPSSPIVTSAISTSSPYSEVFVFHLFHWFYKFHFVLFISSLFQLILLIFLLCQGDLQLIIETF